MISNNNQLADFFTKNYLVRQDLFLAEYEILKDFFQQISPLETYQWRPMEIETIGGSTMIDLFYALQGRKVNVINHDPFEYIKNLNIEKLFDRFIEEFNFSGKLTHYPRNVSNIKNLSKQSDVLALCATQDIVYDIDFTLYNYQHCILYHYGRVWLYETASHLVHSNFKPLLITKNIIFLSKTVKEFDTDNYGSSVYSRQLMDNDVKIFDCK